MAVTFIGDVHGWSDRLERVLCSAEGELVFLGDLIDRGPDAAAVLARVRALCEAGRARCVLGNHEYGILRAIAYEPLGFRDDPEFWEQWSDHWGGGMVLRSFAAATPADLRIALGTHAGWLASLPWVAEGDGWIAVHAGLGDAAPVADQMELLRGGWANADANLPAIFSKARARIVPRDLPPGTALVSGHTPVSMPMVTAERILCDTTGGLPHRQLTGVVWPGGRVIRS